MINTFNELKMEADRMGYNLVPKYQKLIKLHPCTCGCKQVGSCGNYKHVKVSCPRCSRSIEYNRPDNVRSTQKESIQKAREMWNKMIEEENDDFEREG